MADAAQPVAETQAPPAAEQKPVSQEIDYKLEFEKLQGKYKGVQDDLNKFRTRQQEVEAAQQAAEQERLKNAPLEERLKALEQEREDFSKKSGTLEAELKNTKTQLTLLKGGIAPERLDDAAALYERSLSNLKEGEELDFESWIKDRAFLLPAQKAETTETKPVPRVELGSARNSAGNGAPVITREYLASLSSEEYQKLNKSGAIAQAMKDGTLK